MNKSTKFHGIDSSKDVFDVTGGNEVYYQCKNEYDGFK